MIAVAFVVAWSITSTIMTPLRSGTTPVVASVGLGAWVAYFFCVAVLAEAGWPLAVDLLGETVMAAAFCGYMAGGVRPIAYYRHRLPAV